MKKLTISIFAVSLLMVSCSGEGEKDENSEEKSGSKMEQLAEDLAKDVCECMAQSESKEDAFKCRDIRDEEKYKDFDKEELPDDLRKELRDKVQSCVDEARDRIEG